jgi:hypothetical protein
MRWGGSNSHEPMVGHRVQRRTHSSAIPLLRWAVRIFAIGIGYRTFGACVMLMRVDLWVAGREVVEEVCVGGARLGFRREQG